MRFYLFDRVTGLVPGKEATGIKNVSSQEEFLIGHYERRPVMPEPLIIEALAQLGGWAITVSSDYKYFAVMVMIKNVQVSGSALPGDQIALQITIDSINEYAATISGSAAVGGSTILEVGTITYVLYPIPEDEWAAVKQRYCRSSGGFINPQDKVKTPTART